MLPARRSARPPRVFAEGWTRVPAGISVKRRGGLQVVTFQELDERVPFAQQLGAGGAPIVFMNTFHVAPEEVDGFMEAWRVDGEFMQRQPGYVSTQLHRGIAGSTAFVNLALWDSVEAMRNVGSR